MFQINITCLLHNSVNNANSTFHTDFQNKPLWYYSPEDQPKLYK